MKRKELIWYWTLMTLALLVFAGAVWLAFTDPARLADLP